MNRVRVFTLGGAIALMLTIAACGSSAPSGQSGPSATAGASSGAVVKTLHVAGLSVLADTSGMALYTPAQEASGRILCTAANGCTSFWKPVTVTTRNPHGANGIGRLGVIKLSDGTLQLTADSKPAYTFVQDSPGQLNGNGFKDAFAGQHFTWHAILSSGKAAGTSTASSASAGTSASGYGYSPTY